MWFVKQPSDTLIDSYNVRYFPSFVITPEPVIYLDKDHIGDARVSKPLPSIVGSTDTQNTLKLY